MCYEDEIAEMLKDLAQMRRLLLEEIHRSAILLAEANAALCRIETAQGRWARIRGGNESGPLDVPED